MMPGYCPGPSGQTAKVGIRPYLVVTMTSCSSIATVLHVRQDLGAASLARTAADVTRVFRSRGRRAAECACPTDRDMICIAGRSAASARRDHPMFIAMNRFKVMPGAEADFERVWTSRDTHLNDVP